jgi:hypothetical protein
LKGLTHKRTRPKHAQRGSGIKQAHAERNAAIEAPTSDIYSEQQQHCITYVTRRHGARRATLAAHSAATLAHFHTFTPARAQTLDATKKHSQRTVLLWLLVWAVATIWKGATAKGGKSPSTSKMNALLMNKNHTQ